jgi:hypothetical protein
MAAPKKKRVSRPKGCVYQFPTAPGPTRCGEPVFKWKHCHQHVAQSPEDRTIYTQLVSRIADAKQRLTDLGESILNRIVFGDLSITEETLREYRNLWYRHNSLMTIRKNRMPGDELPAEAELGQ